MLEDFHPTSTSEMLDGESGGILGGTSSLKTNEALSSS
jgi:hypothetical protein